MNTLRMSKKGLSKVLKRYLLASHFTFIIKHEMESPNLKILR